MVVVIAVMVVVITVMVVVFALAQHGDPHPQGVAKGHRSSLAICTSSTVSSPGIDRGGSCTCGYVMRVPPILLPVPL
jgi:hypothetical protein